MDENILKLRVGIFVLIAMIILAILISLNSEGWVSQYTVIVKPTNAPGVTVGTPVRKNGILIGRVKEVMSEDDHVRIRLGINQSERIYENEICEIGANSLLGDSVVEFITLPVSTRGNPIQDNATVKHPALKQNPMDAVKSVTDLTPDLQETLRVIQLATNNVGDASQQISNLAQTVQSALQDEDSEFKLLVSELRTMSQKGDAAIDNFNRIFENINDIVGDPEMKAQVKQLVLELPKIFQEFSVTLADTRETIRAFQTIPENINENLNNFKPFTQSLGERGPEILAQVQSTVSNIDDFVDEASQLTDLVRHFNESDGSLKKFITDDEIYRNVVETTRNVRNASAKVEPIMNNIRLGTDQIARNPGVIISGAFQSKRAKYKGTPGRSRVTNYNY